MKKVVVGMSGGVDSSVSALLLKQEGYQVIGMFMKNWEEGEECPAERDFEDVVRVCNALQIPYYSVNFSKHYWDDVFSQFLRDYEAGLTPNPDVLCNREIKFKHLLNKAFELGGDFLATGHYCQIGNAQENVSLLRGLDPNKDQSYFLCQVQQEALRKTLFPIGHLLKSQVRQIARDHNLPTSEKKDSTGICFIGKRNFRDFLGNFVQKKPGPFKTPEGKVVGEHLGLSFYTIGQRKGLGIGGAGEAWYVVEKEINSNAIIVVQGEDHPSLYRTELTATDLHWICSGIEFPLTCTAKVRYRQQDVPCVVDWEKEGVLKVKFSNPVKAVTAGQYIVFYSGNVCLGGGRIKTSGRFQA
jgi:tRNA-specific 2-thiouridylase